MTPIVAIVGRPNVGKSTLFNRLAGAPLAIVHDEPGVTRDRNYADSQVAGRPITLIDTGGFDPTTDDRMGQGIARHVRAAIAEADLILCVLDGSLPPTGPDREAVQLLRRSDKPVLYVANKMDAPEREWTLGDHHALGIPELIPVSALHGRRTGALEAAILRHLPPEVPVDEAEADEHLLRIALIGRPNAGKSSLFNRLSGKERSLVDDRPGTTRDPIDSTIEYKGSRYLIVDTAGVRRRSKVEEGVEAESVIRSIRAVARAHVIVLMCDVTEGIADQDARLIGLAIERGRAVVVGLNKADLIPQNELKKHRDEAAHSLHFATWIPIVNLSAKTGFGVGQLMSTIQEAGTAMRKRIGTSELNRFFEGVLAERQPPTRGGKAPRLYYITQTSVSPPTFVAFSSSPENIDESYRRFVQNRIRTTFNYEAVPLRVFFRGRGRKEEG
ncbi:MAG TPA: ribosome biogenesis GTPase Der [Polyangiaceae bacterium]|nr:ribosome biogenesis GTPase Der [Polyangiaceae bacterium]